MSFFDKLKKGVGIEEIEEDENEEKLTEEPTVDPKKILEENKPKRGEIKISQEVKDDMKDFKEKDRNNWFEQEGQLAVDVFQTDKEIYVQSAIAGINVQDIDITIENDMIMIKGNRGKPTDLDPKTNAKDYFYQECYWGPFSRQIILPAEVDSTKVEAVMKNGILTIKVPKIIKEVKKKVSIKG
jgi:HSP20 family protein